MHTVSVFYFLDPPVVNVEILPGQDNELGKKNVFIFFFSCIYDFFRNQLSSFFGVKIKVG